MNIIALKAQIRVRKWFFKAKYHFFGICLFLAKLRYHLLCFKHFGWRRAVAFMLEAPEHLEAVSLALFTHSTTYLNQRNRNK